MKQNRVVRSLKRHTSKYKLVWCDTMHLGALGDRCKQNR